MRIIPFVLFYLWCFEQNDSFYMLIFDCCIGGLVIWEIKCSLIALQIWSNSYGIDDGMLVNPNSFFGGIIYCITCIFSSYYYMSQLPFNWLCGLIMLSRYIINSTAFVVYFMDINYSFTYSQWTLIYLALYLLNIVTFLIWLFFKYHWLSSLVIEKGKNKQINRPLLNDFNNDQLEYSEQQNNSSSYRSNIQMQSFDDQNNSLNEMHKIGVMGGYNPPQPRSSNDVSMQEFNDYQLAMKLQQEQLYKAAQGKKQKQEIIQRHKKESESQSMSMSSKKYQMHQQQIILDQQQRMIRKQYEKMNAMRQQQKNQSFDSSADNIHQMYLEQQRAVLANSQKLKADGILDVNGDINDEIIKKLDTEMMNNDEGSFGDDFVLIIDAFNVHFDGYNPLQMQMSKRNLVLKATELNHGCWYNVFGTILTRRNVQYHWKLRVREFNEQWRIMAGIMDNRFIAKYENANSVLTNREYFCKHKCGYGVDNKGNLKTDGQNAGQYCKAMKKNDILSIYFDMKQYALWFGLNGEDYNTAFQVDKKGSYKLAVAVFGAGHCIELLSCDVVEYENRSLSDVV